VWGEGLQVTHGSKTVVQGGHHCPGGVEEHTYRGFSCGVACKSQLAGILLGATIHDWLASRVCTLGGWEGRRSASVGSEESDAVRKKKGEGVAIRYRGTAKITLREGARKIY